MSTFDDIIKQKADGHQAPVPPDAWDNIVQKKRKRRFGFFWWTTAILLLCGLSTAIYFAVQPTQKNTMIAKNETTINPITTKDKNNGNPNQATTSTAGDSRIENTVADNSTVPDKKTLLANQTTADAKMKSSQQAATSVMQNNSTSSAQDDIAVLNKSETETKDKKTALPIHTKLIKKIKGKATYQTNGEATAEENESAQNKKTAGSIKTKTTGTEIDENDSEVPKSEALSKSCKKEKSSAFTGTKALSFGEGLGEVKRNERTTNSNVDGEPIKKQQETVAAEKLPAKSKTDSLNKKQTATTENKTNAAAKNKQSKSKHWYIDIAATPILPIQQYSQPASFNRSLSTPNTVSTFSGKLISTSIEPAVAFSLAVRKNINPKTSIGIGFQYLQLKENIDLSGTETHTNYSIVNRLVNGTNGSELISDTVQTITEGTRKINATNSYTLYSIPVFIQYNIVQKTSWSAGITGGVFVNILNQYKNEINQNAPAALIATAQSSTTNGMGLDVYAGLRFGKMLGKKVEFFALPSMRFGLKEYNVKNSLVNKKIQQAGVSFGLSFKIK